MIELSSHGLSISLHHPEDGFYRGTRFDRSGVFGSLRFNGVEFCGQWFEAYDPFMHDAVLGPAEEFSPLFLPEGTLKIGVGLLAPADESSYDRFRLMDVLDPGIWTVESPSAEESLFRHYLPGYYTYEKIVRLSGDNAFEILHTLSADIPLKGDVYNHNFFTLGHIGTGPGRRIDIPFAVEGDWREEYDNASLDSAGFRFLSEVKKGPSVYMGNIRPLAACGEPYSFTVREQSLNGVMPAVHVRASVPMDHAVMWANHRIACLEPYNTFEVLPGESFHWSIRYELSV